MTQIFTGIGLGIQGSSLGLGNFGPKDAAALGQGGDSVFVNAANGNLVLRQSDGFLAQSGFGLDLFQFYNARGESGSNWCFNLQSRLEIHGQLNTPGSSITRIDEDAHTTLFIFDAKKQTYVPEQGGTACVALTSKGLVYKQASEKTSYTYDQQGQLQTISDMDGHSIYFNYQQGRLESIIDSSSKQQILWTFDKGILRDVSTYSEGTIIHHMHFDYDTLGRLQRVSRDLGQGTRFSIDYKYAGDSNQISCVKQSDGTQLHIEYDEQGRVTKLVDGEGRLTRYEYQLGTTKITNGLGESWYYVYDDRDRLLEIKGPEQWSIKYEYQGNYLSRIVQGNQIWNYTYNDAGDCIRIEEPNGQVTKRSYDAQHHLILETHYQSFDASHNPIKPKSNRYIYDERGHLRFSIGADGSVIEMKYNQGGQLVSKTCYLHAYYSIAGLAEDTLLRFEEVQAWVHTLNPQDVSLVDYVYDWRGQLTEEIHYSRVDSFGKGLALDAKSIRTVYDAAGRLIEKSKPGDKGWSTTHYIYDDLDRLLQTIDNQGHSKSFQYDDEHQRIIETDTNGLQTVRIYDRSGLLLSEMRLDKIHDYGTINYKYDAAGRLIAKTGVNDVTQYFFYDGQGRLQAQVSTTGIVTEYVYSNDGLLLLTHEYQMPVIRDGWLDSMPEYSQLKLKSSRQDRISQNIYNQYNQLAYTIDAHGGVLGYKYDAQGRLVCESAYAVRLANFDAQKVLGFDDIELVEDVKDRSTYYYYDALGRVQAKINAEGYAIAYTYDVLGNVVETCKYSKRVLPPLTGEWSLDQPEILTNKDIHNYSLYDASGLKIADIDAEGYVTEYQYNAAGLLTEKNVYAKKTSLKNQSIDDTTTLEQLRPSVSPNDHKTVYFYDDLGQLVKEQAQNGLVIAYEYNQSGLILSKTTRDFRTQAARQEHYVYDALGRVIKSFDAKGSTQYEYNNEGLLLSKTNALLQTTYYFYDENQQLRYQINADGAVTETRYNAFSQLELSKNYSEPLKIQVQGLHTDDIAAHLALLQDNARDESNRYEYNNLGQLIAKYSGSRGLIKTEYNVFGELESSSQSIDEHNYSTNKYYYDRRGLITQTKDDVKTKAFEYDAFGNQTQQTDARFNKISYLYNKRGEQIGITNASNHCKRTSYDAFGRILTETDFTASKIVKRYTYDDVSNKLILEDPLTQTQIITSFNVFGDKIAITDAKGNTTSFEYNEQGQLIRIDSPEHSFKQYQYDPLGMLSWQLESGGKKTTYTYDAQGRILTKTVDPEGLKLVTKFQYDAIGRQISITEANNCKKKFVYDDQGNLIQSIVDVDGLNLLTEFSYDNRGLLIKQTEFNSRGKNKIITYEWDKLGRRTASINDPDGLNLKTSYAYDANDNLICVTDANQHSTHYIYDVNNRLSYQIDARGVVNEHIYDANGNEIETIIYANKISALANYDSVDLQAAVRTDPIKDHFQFRSFDDQGRVITSYDAQGYACSYTYDANGNTISVCKYAKAASLQQLKLGNKPVLSKEGARYQHFIYDGLNRLQFESDSNGYITQYQYAESGEIKAKTRFASRIDFDDESIYNEETVLSQLQKNPLQDQTTRYVYDKAGRLITELSPQGYAKSYRYDALGNLVTSTTYANKFQCNDDSALDQLQWIPGAGDRSTYFVYDAAGRELYRISSEGQVLERTYDDVGNIIQEQVHSQLINLGQYDENSIKNSLLTKGDYVRTSNFEYDAASRLLSQVSADKLSTKYTYDAQGNVVTKTQANQAVWTYEYDEANQLITIVSPQTMISTKKTKENRSIITRMSYDSFGNVLGQIKDAEGLKQRLFFEYDNNSRKIKTIYPDVAINIASSTASSQRQETVQTLSEDLSYNAFGEIIASNDKAGNRKRFVYDAQGQLIFSLDAKGGLTQYTYNAFGQVTEKIAYAQAITISQGSAVSLDSIAEKITKTGADRKEYYQYNLDNQLIETTRNAVRMYNAKTDHYDSLLKPSTKYQYNAFGELIKSSSNLNETEWAENYFYYNKDGKKIAAIDAEGYLTTYSYNAFGEMSSMTEYANAIRFYNCEGFDQAQACKKDRTLSFTYNELGQVSSKTLVNSSYQDIASDNKSFSHKIGDLTTLYTYDALGNVSSITDAKGNTSYKYYDALGQLIAKVAPKTKQGWAATTNYYDGLGNLVESKRWANGVRQADADHFVLNSDSAQDIVNTQEYDVFGQVLVQTDGENQRTEYSYDANGNLARSWKKISQANNSILIQDKCYTYDSENNLVQTATFKSNNTLKTEDTQYNVFNEVCAKGIDGNLNTHIEYDVLGRVWRSNTQGYYQIFVYDLTGNVTQTITSTNAFREDHSEAGLDLSSEKYEFYERFDLENARYDLQRENNTYNKLGHLIRQAKNSTSQSQTCDRWGNIISATNAKGYTSLYEYNVFNKMIKQESPEVKVVDEHGVGRLTKPTIEYAYDALGQAIGVKDANNHISTKDYDALGQILIETDAKGSERTKQYNLLGQLSSTTSELGAITNYTYDKADRVASIKTPKTSKQYRYNEDGQIIQQKCSDKEILTYEYDSLGNQIAVSDERRIKTRYEYDDAGHKIKETDALGHTQTWTYNDQGRLVHHKDLGGHQTNYEYNTNGLILKETASTGKHIQYHYQADGQLLQYVDAHNNREEVVNFTYDDLGQVESKSSSRTGDYKEGWLKETDYYEYDSLGRLVKIRRKNPQDIDDRFPEKDNSILSIDYEYDAVGNVRHTQMRANYSGYKQISSDDYYAYDANDRMIISKGELINDEIVMGKNKGSTLAYDEAGNIKQAQKYENNNVQHYQYQYDVENRLELVQKNGHNVQTKQYDALNRVTEERLFDESGILAQRNVMNYENGLLVSQRIKNNISKEVSLTNYYYDAVGNVTSMSTRVNGQGDNGGFSAKHEYQYELWDTYLESVDNVSLSIDDNNTTRGKSLRKYDANGQLQDVEDQQADSKGKTHTSHYWISSIEGMKSKQDSEGITSYLNINGKTLGDVHINHDGSQQLNIYAGFNPTGSQEKTDLSNGVMPEVPQENLGTYTVQAGDSLETIAQQIYGDSSLWYLIADRNGINDKNVKASDNGALKIGQRINIPPVATNQHYTNNTQRVLSNYDKIGNTSATTSGLSALGTNKNNSPFAAIIVAVVSTVATVLTAGIAGAIEAGVVGLADLGSFSSLFATGLKILNGGLLASSTGSIASGFTASFVGAIANQCTAKALGLQEQIDLKGSLITAITTAATAGLAKTLGTSSTYQNLFSKLDHLEISKSFSLSSAAEIIQDNITSQALTMSIKKHQSMDWLSLGTSALTAGLLNSNTTKQLTQTLNQIDNNTHILSKGLETLSHAATKVATGLEFSASQMLNENLEGVIGGWLVDREVVEDPVDSSKNQIYDYCPMQGDQKYTPIPENFYQQFHEDRIREKLESKTVVEDIDYEKLYAAKGHAYRKEQIITRSFYYKSPASPIEGDVSKETQKEVINAIIASCKDHGLGLHDTAHVLAIAKHESGFNPYAAAGTSSATGIGQFTDDTRKDYKVKNSDMWKSDVQIEAMVRLFIKYKDKYGNQGDQYIYKYYHDGPNAHNKKDGFALSKNFVLPKIQGIENEIKKMF